MTAVKAANIHIEPKRKGRTSLGQVWGEETNSTLLSTISGGYRNPLVSTLEAQPAETCVLTKGLVTAGGVMVRLWTHVSPGHGLGIM